MVLVVTITTYTYPTRLTNKSNNITKSSTVGGTQVKLEHTLVLRMSAAQECKEFSALCEQQGPVS
eukprot:5864992-Amphidinium_carterae.2